MHIFGSSGREERSPSCVIPLSKGRISDDMETIKLKCTCGREVLVSNRILAVKCPDCGNKIYKQV